MWQMVDTTKVWIYASKCIVPDAKFQLQQLEM